MLSFNTKQIIKKGVEKGFKYNSFEFSILGDFNSSDSMFNHRDIPHFNHLHPNLAYGYGNEGIYYGDVVSFIRYFKFLGISFPILTLMKDDGENRVLETFSFFCFQFLKLNEEVDRPNDKCLSKITYYIGSRNKILLSLATPFFKKMFRKSFNDYKNDDHPFLNRRGFLKKNGFDFDRDKRNFSYDSTLNIVTQRCFFNGKIEHPKNINIDLSSLENNAMTKFGEIGIMGFQIDKVDNTLKIFSRVCPHEGGDLDTENEVGIKYTYEDYKAKGCKVSCNVHKRMFDPIITINDYGINKSYNSDFYNFNISNNMLSISLKKGNLDFKKQPDWTL